MVCHEIQNTFLGGQGGFCRQKVAEHDTTWETTALSANVLPESTLHLLSGLCLGGYFSIVPTKIYT